MMIVIVIYLKLSGHHQLFTIANGVAALNMAKARSPIPDDAPNAITTKARQRERCLTNAGFHF